MKNHYESTKSSTSVESIKLTDTVSIAIVEQHQRSVGDRNPGRTLTRIIQAFQHAGMSLTPSNTEAKSTAA